MRGSGVKRTDAKSLAMRVPQFLSRFPRFLQGFNVFAYAGIYCFFVLLYGLFVGQKSLMWGIKFGINFGFAA